MEFVKLKTRYYLDGALLRAGEAAEVLWLRGKAYAGDQESDGFIPVEVLPLLTPTRGKARAAALVREGLWEVVPGGWRDTFWDEERQETKASLDQKREAGRRRVAQHRARSNGTSNAVTNTERRSGERREKREDAAAAASREPLPPPLEILRSKLDAARLVVRWDRLTPAQHTEIEQLIDIHGDGPLVKAAIASHRPDSPAAFAQAWIRHWQALTPPGAGLRAVNDPPCPEPGHSGTTKHCAQCASERIERKKAR